MGSLLLPVFQNMLGSTEAAWRTVSIIPAFVAFITGVLIYLYTDDAPKGNYHEYREKGIFKEISIAQSCSIGTMNITTWVLFFQYACCFGVELTMQTMAAIYFQIRFAQSIESASAISSLFGWMNLFARGMGGYASDKCNAKYGMRGRIVVQCLFLTGEAISSHILSILFFCQTKAHLSYSAIPEVSGFLFSS